MSDAENLEAAYAFVSSMVGRADDAANLMWHGWALREAFMAGAARLQAERDAAQAELVTARGHLPIGYARSLADAIEEFMEQANTAMDLRDAALARIARLEAALRPPPADVEWVTQAIRRWMTGPPMDEDEWTGELAREIAARFARPGAPAASFEATAQAIVSGPEEDEEPEAAEPPGSDQ